MKSHARFTSQHYNPRSSRSNLAKSLLNNRHHAIVAEIFQSERGVELSDMNIGTWIEQNTSRYHYFLGQDQPDVLLSLLEVFFSADSDRYLKTGRLVRYY